MFCCFNFTPNQKWKIKVTIETLESYFQLKHIFVSKHTRVVSLSFLCSKRKLSTRKKVENKIWSASTFMVCYYFLFPFFVLFFFCLRLHFLMDKVFQSSMKQVEKTRLMFVDMQPDKVEYLCAITDTYFYVFPSWNTFYILYSCKCFCKNIEYI